MNGETTYAPDDRVRELRRQLMRDAMAIAAYALPVGLGHGLVAAGPISAAAWTSSCLAS